MIECQVIFILDILNTKFYLGQPAQSRFDRLKIEGQFIFKFCDLQLGRSVREKLGWGL